MPQGFSIKWDDKRWRNTLRQYLAISRKSAADVLNAKTRDLHFKSSKSSPKANRSDILTVVDNPRWASWIANRVYGPGMWDQDDRDQLWKKVRGRRLSAVAYQKSGFIKAANEFPAPPSTSTRPGRQTRQSSTRHPGTRTTVSIATPRKLDASYLVSWAARNEEDARGKGELAERAMGVGMRSVILDTEKYLARKMKEGWGLARKKSS